MTAENNTRLYNSVDSPGTGRRQGNQADQVTPSIFFIYLSMEQPLYIIIIPSTHKKHNMYNLFNHLFD